MKKSFLFILPIICFTSVASADTNAARAVQWSSNVNDFEFHQIVVEKGNHFIIAAADKPVFCKVYRNGENIASSLSEGTACYVNFESKDKEELTFFIMYHIKSVPRSKFEYHAGLM